MDGNKNVYLLDDGGRAENKQLALSLGVIYITRNDRAFFKSGNLNHALGLIDEKYVAVFDADFVPHPNFLQETIPFFEDPTIGIVQTPQVYSNEDNMFSKGGKNLQASFYNYIMPTRHMQKSAFCVGTNVVYKKEALDKIGGIASVNHSEDVFTSLEMNMKGYHVFFVNKVLATGLSPTNVISFFNQQYRWARGGMTMLLKHNTLFNKKLTRDQRIHYFMSNIFYLTGFSILIYLISPFVAILFNVRPINPLYFKEWFTTYLLFFGFNTFSFLYYSKKYRVETIGLALFCVLPYIKAFFSVLINQSFRWTITNTVSKDLVTKIVAPVIIYLAVCLVSLYLILTGSLYLGQDSIVYFGWIIINMYFYLYLLANSYAVRFYN